MKINTIRGPWFSLGIHIDFKHKHIDIHFWWWVIILGNTYEPIYCGYCNGEMPDDALVCPHCGVDFQVTNFLQSAISLYLAGDMDNERWEFENNNDEKFSYVDCEFNQRTTRYNHMKLGIIVDGDLYTITIRKIRKDNTAYRED